ncbi:hypothetical protein [Acidisphaera sp. S103]|uniref:hypothetical protein n=1 Tax=Acidisphaera sp. S103 TaxID=1747223 RepID=UPI00131E9FD8|nr:hypothetical protein [Acidisphaera sp. S103]
MPDPVALHGYGFADASAQKLEPLFRVIDDGVRTYGSTSWKQGTPLFSVFTAVASMRFSPVTTADGKAATAVRFIPPIESATGPKPDWVGRLIAIASMDPDPTVIVSRVVEFTYDPASRFLATLVLEGCVPESLDETMCRIACPCFDPADIGKRIWISNAAHPNAGHGNPIAITPFRGTIARVVNPFSVELAEPITALSQSDKPGSLIVWGTDNSSAVRSFGRRALAAGLKALRFTGSGRPNSTGLACLFDWVPNHGPANPAEIAGSAAMAALHWITIDCELLILSACGKRGNEYSGGFQDSSFRKGGVPWNASPAPAPAKGVVARQHFPRCASLDDIVVVVTGDSWAVTNSGGHAGNDHTVPIIDELIRQNPAKRIRVVNRAIGAAAWAWLNRRREPSGPLPAWYSDPEAPWLSYIETVTLGNGETRTPDLVLILMTGNNDSAPGGAIHRNDLASVIGKIRGWPRVNGHPPDIAMMCGGTKDVELFTPGGGLEAYYLSAEYVTGFVRSFARCNKIGLFDLGTAMGLLTDGWATEHLTLRQVPPLLAAPATPTTPYVTRYLCRDFYMAIRLGDADETAESFWSQNRCLSISLSQKGDNRLWLGPDSDGNLVVCAVSWGMPVQTSYKIEPTSNCLTTAGHESGVLRGIPLRTAAPGFGISSDGHFHGEMVGQCLLIPSIGFQGTDYRTTIQSFTNSENIFASDGNATALPARTFHVGGQMFVTSDASANADCIVGGAGTDDHLLTGRGSLVTRCATDGFRDYRAMQLQKPPIQIQENTVGTVFLGAITQQPTYDEPIPVTRDLGTGAVLTVRVQGSRARIGYVRGGRDDMDCRTRLRNHEEVVWQGEIERMGGPFVPKIWSATSTMLQVVDMWIGEKDVFMPQLTHREVWGVGDPDCTWPSGGDTSHMSQMGISRIIGRVAATQDLVMGMDRVTRPQKPVEGNH